MKRFTVACIQTNCQDDLAANVAAILPMVKKAAQQGAQLICLPENAFLMEDHSQKRYQPPMDADKHPGVLGCAEIARRYGVWVLIGSIAVADTLANTVADSDAANNSAVCVAGGSAFTGKMHNTALLLDDSGNICCEYQKIHLFDVDLPNGESYRESNRFSAGRYARVAALPWGKLGLSVCYDVRFAHLYRQLAQAGAEMLAVPAAFTRVTGEAHWHVLLRARAIENGCFLFAAAQTGEHPGKRFTYGHSLIVDPWGKVLADAGSEPGIITARIDMEQVAAVRARIPSLQHDREFVLCP